jgi:hypothetical protein
MTITHTSWSTIIPQKNKNTCPGGNAATIWGKNVVRSGRRPRVCRSRRCTGGWGSRMRGREQRF